MLQDGGAATIVTAELGTVGQPAALLLSAADEPGGVENASEFRINFPPTQRLTRPENSAVRLFALVGNIVTEGTQVIQEFYGAGGREFRLPPVAAPWGLPFSLVTDINLPEDLGFPDFAVNAYSIRVEPARRKSDDQPVVLLVAIFGGLVECQ